MKKYSNAKMELLIRITDVNNVIKLVLLVRKIIKTVQAVKKDGNSMKTNVN